MKLEDVYTVLNKVLPYKVFYAMNVYDDRDNAAMPYIVYQEIGRRPIGYADNKPLCYTSLIQITLVTKRKDLLLEKNLESMLLDNNFNYSLISEFANSDQSLNRVYEIRMEE